VPGETQLIERYFLHLGAVRADVPLGIGDDAALLRAAPGHELVQTTDSLVPGAHFLADDAPRSLGHRALAINLSDLAAMGATPAWALLSLTLPEADEQWLAEFAAGFGRLAREQGVALVGGNLVRGPLNIAVTLTGQVPQGTALRRSGAAAGDELWVSGTPGEARAGLRLRHPELCVAADPGGTATDMPSPEPAAPGADAAQRAALVARWEYPAPRVALGQALRTLARAAIDISDGLQVDLARLAAANGCGALLEPDALPVSPALRALAGAQAWREVLVGGEDYELCIAAAAGQGLALQAAAAASGTTLTRIGRLVPGAGLALQRDSGVMQVSDRGFDHFAR
jgi:thiamine-monophosphate kinase